MSRQRGLRAFLCLAACAWTPGAIAAGGSYATGGTGTYAQSLWWLDMSGYSDSAASLGGSALSFTLPNGAGTLTATATKAAGLSVFNPTAEPPAAGVGAFGHGAYNGITGSPILYTQTLIVNSAVTFRSFSVADASGNARSFTFYAADGENTSSGENISLTSSAPWTLVDTVNYFPGYSGTAPTVAGSGTTTVTESGSSGNAYNASYVFGTSNPSTVTSSVLGTQGVLFALSLPTVSFTVITQGRADTSDQFSATLSYTSPAVILKSVATTATTSAAATGALSVIGTNSLTLGAGMAAGSASPLSYYGGSMVCTNAGPGATGYGGTATVLPGGSGTSFTVTPKTGDAISCTLTLTPVAQTVKGTVYNDANHDSSLDGAEAGTALAGLYIKLASSSGGVCAATATAAAAVDATVGTYSLPAVATGTYCLTLSNNGTLTSTTPYRPPGWVNSEVPTGVRALNAAIIPAPAQNFGLYNGSSLSVAVFGDTGAGGGIGNDGIQNGTESGLGGIAVAATLGGSAVAGAITGGSGTAVLWVPAGTSGIVTVSATPPTGDIATGGSAGTTGGSYARPNVTFTYAVGSAYTGITLGFVAPNTLVSSDSQTAASGTIVFHPHVYTAASAGQVTFNTIAVATPALPGWNEVLYLDVACSGQFATGDPLVGGPITASAAQRVCVLLKEFVPSGAPLNAQNKVTLNASFAYSGSAAPAAVVLTNTDATIAAGTGTQLLKQVQNVTQAGSYGVTGSALPGNLLQYQLTIVNQGTAPLSTIVLNDATPAYTTFVAAACPGTLPTSLTGCALSTQPTTGGAGPVQWTFSGTLAPGTQTTVTFEVNVTQ